MKNGASAIIFSDNKILLFLRDNIATIPFPNCWALPGGQIEDGETPDIAISRELQEEVSFVPPNLRSIGFTVNTNNTVYVYCAFVNSSDEKYFSLGKGEGQKIAFFTLNEMDKLQLTAGVKYYLTDYRKEIEQIIKTRKAPSAEFLGLIPIS